ncbi:2-haloalkanoic acid dehalogenase [Roseovarius atlanticus]|uniref:2-haloalkanoic acid dehalogenase n=1 Tax=Roseovarius atlanticus TaxID=1641875 RepID=A0A0T5NPI4_9RHOB|nr:HAD-IA family hydrolase [Roseovarius atlanticus]KRS10856.1 2-haloalkanoic acid dehalogenase [Roseovarius atlanticus]
MTQTTATKPLSAFSYVSFDVVGTLIDFESAIIGAIESIASEAGVQLDREEVLSLYGAARRAPEAGLFPDDLGRCYAGIAAKFGLPDTPELRSRVIEAVGEAEPFADSVEALESLAARFRLIAMTNARRWAFEKYEAKLGHPFWASFTTDDTGTEKPDPAFFHKVFAFVEEKGGTTGGILHTAQSQYHDIGVSRQLGMTNAWIERRHGQAGYGGTIAPESFTEPDYHFKSLGELADAVARDAGP